MAGEERNIDSMLGMVIAIVAIVYTIVVNFLEIFRKKKAPPAVSRDPVKDLFESLKKREREEESEKEEGLSEEGLSEEELNEEELEEVEEEYTEEKRVKKPFSQPVVAHEVTTGWRTPEEKFILHSTIEDFRQKTKIEGRQLTIGLHTPEELVSNAIARPTTAVPKIQSAKAMSPIQLLVQRLPNKKALIIASEIIQPPIGFRRKDR